jgi:hypothetical protein
MGYLSQVKSIIYAEKGKIDSFINDNKESFKFLQEAYEDDLKVIDNDNEKIIFLSGDSWKWYDDYKDVMAWNDFMDLADKNKLCVEFVRIGEEPEDIETAYRGEPDELNYYIYPTSYIDVNF